MSAAPVAEGDVVFDKYRVERVLGKGGMGVVVAAMHVDLEQRVALKFLLPEALQHPDIVERFAREAKAAAKIRSQHVVRVIDTGRMPNGAPFMVMEHLDGQDLGDVLDEGGPIPLGVAVDYVLQACEAIAEAHAAGIVHRDLKPSNLFLARQPDRRAIIKVLDFGISKIADPKGSALTGTAVMMGSPQYMSPEQLTSSRDVDVRSDIWALGVILYELVTGVRPFDAETMPEIVGKILQNTPDRPSSLREGIPLDFEVIVSRCLASDPRRRYATVGELADALAPLDTDPEKATSSADRIRRVLGGSSLRPPTPDRAFGTVGEMPTRLDVATGTAPTAAVAPAVVPAAPATASSDEVGTKPPGRSKLAVPVGVAALAVAGVIGIVVSRGSPATPTDLAPSASHAATTTLSPLPSASSEPAPSSLALVAPPASIAEAPLGSTAASVTPPPARSAGDARPVARLPPAHPSSTAASAAPSTAVTSDPKKSPLDMGIK